MTSAFDSMTAAADSAVLDFAGQSVSYHRGDASVELTAVHSRGKHQLADAYGAEQEFETDDFLIPVASLILSEAAATPAMGDRIKVASADGETLSVYECLQQPGLPHYTIEAAGTRYRIRTKFIDTEAA